VTLEKDNNGNVRIILSLPQTLVAWALSILVSFICGGLTTYFQVKYDIGSLHTVVNRLENLTDPVAARLATIESNITHLQEDVHTVASALTISTGPTKH